MSRKLTNTGLVCTELQDLSVKQIKQKIIETFHLFFGRYENASGKMWVEVLHKGGDDYTKGQVIWRKGTIGKSALDAELVLERETAIPMFMELVEKGYTQVFNGVTEGDIDKGNALRLERQSAPQREGWLGIYHRGAQFFRISQFKPNEYYIEYGYDGMAIKTSIESEAGARFELDLALDKGFKREGEEIEEFVNPLEAFGLELNTIESAEYNKQLEAKKSEPIDGELSDEFFELMR